MVETADFHTHRFKCWLGNFHISKPEMDWFHSTAFSKMLMQIKYQKVQRAIFFCFTASLNWKTNECVSPSNGFMSLHVNNFSVDFTPLNSIKPACLFHCVKWTWTRLHDLTNLVVWFDYNLLDWPIPKDCFEHGVIFFALGWNIFGPAICVWLQPMVCVGRSCGLCFSALSSVKANFWYGFMTTACLAWTCLFLLYFCTYNLILVFYIYFIYYYIMLLWAFHTTKWRCYYGHWM